MSSQLDITASDIAKYVSSYEIEVASAGRTRLTYRVGSHVYTITHNGEQVGLAAVPERAAEVFNATVRAHS